MKFAPKAIADTSPNIAPLLDVVLLLLIFFMVTTSFAAHQIPLDLPDAEASSVQASEAIVITIDSKGTYAIEDQVLSQTELAERLQSFTTADMPLEIRADAATPHGDVVRVLDLANQYGLTQIGIRVDAAQSRAPSAPN